jgi:pimeloyl-ACP methyl ester carboxylesterase
MSAVVKNIVLVHGAFADGSSWSKVIPILEQMGYSAVAVQNPLLSLADEVAFTKRIIALQDGPVILVGHSWGGAVITQAGDDSKVAGLVYVTAEGLPLADRKLFFAVQGQSYGPMFDEKLTVAAWKTKPTWAVISTKDQMLPPAMELASCKTIGAVTTTISTCHMSILEAPDLVAAVIDEAAKSALNK